MSEPAEEPEPSEPMDEAAALEARRKRREAIKAKYRSQATPMHLKALQVPDGETDSSTPGTEPTSAQDMSGRSYGPRQNYVEQKLMCADSLG
jgi:serine/threonine-protein kinase PRP4